MPPLPTPTRLDDDDARAVLEVLEAELAVPNPPERLALLLHEVGIIARDHAGDGAFAAAAFEAAEECDAGFPANRWARAAVLHDAPDAIAALDAHVRWAGATVDAWDRHRLGHLVLAAGGTFDEALPHWNPDGVTPGKDAGDLACALSARLTDTGGDRGLETALDRAAGPVLSGVLLLDVLARRGSEPGPDVEAWFDEALARLGGSAALLAMLEPRVARHGDHARWHVVLRARFETVAAALERGELPEGQVREELGEVLSKSAWALEQMGRGAEAFREYQHALHWLPDDLFIAQRGGELARQLGRPEEQRAYLERIAHSATDPAEAANALYQMGQIAATALGDEARAAADFERSVHRLPTFTPALAALGRQAIRQGRWHEITTRFEVEIARLEATLEEDPTGPTPPARDRIVRALVTRYYRIARLLEDKVLDLARAEEFDRRALAIAPDFLPPLLAIERRLEESGDWDALQRLYIRLGERAGPSPEAVPFLLRAGEVARVHRGDDEGAARLLRRVRDLAPDHIYALWRSAEVFERLGDRGAQLEVERACAARMVDRDVAVGHRLRAGLLQELAGPRGAAARAARVDFVWALARRPDDPVAWDGVVRTHAQLDDGTGLRDALPHAAAPAAIEVIVCDALLALGERDAAVVRARRALERRPDEDVARALFSILDRAYPPGTDPAERIAVAEVRAEHASDDAEASSYWVEVGEIAELALHDQVRAREAYSKALALDPQNLPAQWGAVRSSASPERSGTSSPLSAARGAEVEPWSWDRGAVAFRALLAAHNEPVAATRAAEAWLVADPDAIAPRVSACLAARARGDAAAFARHAEEVAERCLVPENAARWYFDSACARAACADDAGAEMLLMRAVEADPGHASAADRLETRWRATAAWDDIDALLARRIDASSADAIRVPLLRRRARLLAEVLDRPAEAVPLLGELLSAEPDDAEALLMSIDVSIQIGDEAGALTCLARAEAHSEPRVRAGALVRRARMAHAAGDDDSARLALDAAVELWSDAPEAWTLRAELDAAGGDWPGVLAALQRLWSTAEAPDARAGHAMAIGEVLDRIYADPCRAAGWFQRAIEMCPARRDAVWRMLDTVRAAGPGAVPTLPVRAALRAAAERLDADVARSPRSAEVLEDVARLASAIGNVETGWLATSALVAIGAADADTRRAWTEIRDRVRADFVRPLGQDERARWLVCAGETGDAAQRYSILAPALVDVFARPCPAGAVRISRRSYPSWQADFLRLARDLGAGEIALYRVEADLIDAGYGPEPSIFIGESMLRAGVDARQAFWLGHLLEGLRGGRLLLEEPGPDAAWAAAAALAAVADRRSVDALPDELTAAVIRCAPQLSAEMTDAARAVRDGDAAERAAWRALARAARITRDRAGLVVAGDVVAAYEAVGGGSDSERADAVIAYALGADHRALRRAVEVTLT